MTHNTLTEQGKQEAIKIIEKLKEFNIEARIARTYRDYEQDWTWDTILVRAKNDTYQALSPRQFDSMNDGTFSLADFNSIITTAKNFNK